MGFGANIWSETGHGEGRLGDFGGGRQEQQLLLFLGLFWLPDGTLGLLRSQKTRGRGEGLLGFGALKISLEKKGGPC